MSQPTTSERHIWQYGHVGEHPTYGIVTLYDVDGQEGPASPENAKFLHFVNAKGEIHTQRDDGQSKLGVTFLHDSGYVDPHARDGDSVFLSPFIRAFRDGKFDKPNPPVPDQVTDLRKLLEEDHPGLRVSVEEIPAEAVPAGRQFVISITGSHCILTRAVLAQRPGFDLVDLRVRRSGAVAVTVMTWQLLQPVDDSANETVVPSDVYRLCDPSLAGFSPDGSGGQAGDDAAFSGGMAHLAKAAPSPFTRNNPSDSNG